MSKACSVGGREMGKQRKLRSSIKALHDALTSFRPAVGAPLCMQPSKTHSFRDIFASFDSVDYVLPVAAAASPASSYSGAPPCSTRHGLLLGHYPRESPPSAEAHGLACKVEEAGEDEGSISVSAATSSSTSCSSSLSSTTSSSSLAAAAPDNAEAKDNNPFPSGIACSERFFFSPCSSKSIAAAEYSSPEMGPKKAASVPGGSEGGDYGDEDDVLLEREIGDTLSDSWAAAATGVSALCRESVPVAFSSRDLYGDFRSSMEEMVAAHGLRDWPDLQELLHCYLRLNDKENHKVIALAFVDLLVHLPSPGKLHSSAVHGAAASTPVFFPSPPPPPLPPAPSGLHPSPC